VHIGGSCGRCWLLVLVLLCVVTSVVEDNIEKRVVYTKH
jgi:hypothetical protein